MAGAILVVIDADRKISLINQKGCEVLGYKEEEIIGVDWFDRFLPEWSRDSVRTGFDMLMRGEIQPAEYFENPVVTKSGEERMIAWHNTVLRDEAGRVIGTLSSGQDITERKKTEIELWRHRERLEELVQQRTLDLLHSEEKYRTLVENVPLAVYRVKPDGQILFLNRFVKEVFGFSPAEIYRNPRLWSERVYEEDRAEVEDLRAKSLDVGKRNDRRVPGQTQRRPYRPGGRACHSVSRSGRPGHQRGRDHPGHHGDEKNTGKACPGGRNQEL